MREIEDATLRCVEARVQHSGDGRGGPADPVAFPEWSCGAGQQHLRVGEQQVQPGMNRLYPHLLAGQAAGQGQHGGTRRGRPAAPPQHVPDGQFVRRFPLREGARHRLLCGFPGQGPALIDDPLDAAREPDNRIHQGRVGRSQEGLGCGAGLLGDELFIHLCVGVLQQEVQAVGVASLLLARGGRGCQQGRGHLRGHRTQPGAGGLVAHPEMVPPHPGQPRQQMRLPQRIGGGQETLAGGVAVKTVRFVDQPVPTARAAHPGGEETPVRAGIQPVTVDSQETPLAFPREHHPAVHALLLGQRGTGNGHRGPQQGAGRQFPAVAEVWFDQLGQAVWQRFASRIPGFGIDLPDPVAVHPVGVAVVQHLFQLVER